MSEGQYGQYELVMNTEIEDFNLELLQDYWSFSNIERNIYTFTMKDLLKKYDIGSPSKLERIVKQCGYLKFSELKDCKKCYFHHEIFIRKNLSPKRKYGNTPCK